ncbi:MAG: hypothetical protein HYR83_05320 [Planctomycetes bacterium]|nr:hypothetical protein [Planctomycetota bacterium]
MKNCQNRAYRLRASLRLASVSIISLSLPAAIFAAPLPTTLDNFFMKGTQPDPTGAIVKPIRTASNCRNCHETPDPSDPGYPIYSRWQGSMMANAFRDPVFQAALAIANQDAAFAGDLCLRCHAPGGWLGGRSLPVDGSAMRNEDFEGVSCHFCHRLVDPVPHPENPPQDDPIRAALAAIDLLPDLPGGGSFVIDPNDVRRGPFALDPNAPIPGGNPGNPPYIPQNAHIRMKQCTAGANQNKPCNTNTDCPGGLCSGLLCAGGSNDNMPCTTNADCPGGKCSGNAPIIESALHGKADLCATCHDVSNPAFTRQPQGSYALNVVGQPHATQNKYDMFPIERTFSEWTNSTYAAKGVDAHGVFGGTIPNCNGGSNDGVRCAANADCPGGVCKGIVSTCQDCHMPPSQTFGCILGDPFYERPDVPEHNFNGGNAWVQDMLLNLYGGVLTPDYLYDSQQRARFMLENASTMELTNESCRINVRIVNQAGHKLPSGYPEGRRMWLNVEFRGPDLHTITEHGAYDNVNANLTTPDTRVYEVKLGLDASMAATTGLAVGESFHFALNNKVYKDNRIPPRGFSNAAFEAVQAAPVDATYADGQYWSDTKFHIPPGATSAVVNLYYQTASKEYVIFLRDQNQTNDKGSTLYDQWQLTGMSPP